MSLSFPFNMHLAQACVNKAEALSKLVLNNVYKVFLGFKVTG